MRLALFDLDHTLLDGDSDTLWCEFLIEREVLDAASFGERNAQMTRDYRAGNVGTQAFCEFYVATLAARTRAEWDPLRAQFMRDVIAPRMGTAAQSLVRQHRHAGDLVLLTTATNRYIAEPAAEHLGIEHLIATECEADAAGNFTGRTVGLLNMREGKVDRLMGWLSARGLAWADCDATFYSDSINDLALLAAVRRPMATNPDARLAAVAAERGWPIVWLHGTGTAA